MGLLTTGGGKYAHDMQILFGMHEILQRNSVAAPLLLVQIKQFILLALDIVLCFQSRL